MGIPCASHQEIACTLPVQLAKARGARVIGAIGGKVGEQAIEVATDRVGIYDYASGS